MNFRNKESQTRRDTINTSCGPNMTDSVVTQILLKPSYQLKGTMPKGHQSCSHTQSPCTTELQRIEHWLHYPTGALQKHGYTRKYPYSCRHKSTPTQNSISVDMHCNLLESSLSLSAVVSLSSAHYKTSPLPFKPILPQQRNSNVIYVRTHSTPT